VALPALELDLEVFHGPFDLLLALVLLEVVEVGEHDLGQVELEQVDLLAQDEGEQEVEGAVEDLEVELQRG